MMVTGTSAYSFEELPSLQEKFLKKISVGNDGCWVWCGPINNRWGYAQWSINGKTVRVNRVAFQMFKGRIPDGMLVCHSCDVRACVNPDHLWLGTHKDNTDDMVN